MNHRLTTLTALVLTAALTLPGCAALNQRDDTCTVTAKESVTIRTGDGSTNQYRVYTEECGTLAVTDDLSIARYNSADLYGQLREDTTYTMRIGGYRSGVMSMFPNIISATPVE